MLLSVLLGCSGGEPPADDTGASPGDSGSLTEDTGDTGDTDTEEPLEGPCPAWFGYRAEGLYRKLETLPGSEDELGYTATLTEIVTSFDPDGLIEVTVDIDFDQGEYVDQISTEVWSCDPEGAWKHSSRVDIDLNGTKAWVLTEYQPPFLFMPADVEPGDTWEMSTYQEISSSGNISTSPSGELHQTAEALGEGIVTTEAGTFDALEIEWTFEEGEPSTSHRHRSLGLVLNSALQLVSYTE